MRKILASIMAALTLFAPAAALANPSSYANGTSTSAATTTKGYMTPGTGTTTTPVYDSYAQTFSGGITSKADYAGLLVQLTGSSTAAVLNGAVEYSQDGIDWYRNFLLDPKQISTTSPSFAIVTPNSFTWKFASSTVGGSGLQANNDVSTAALVIPTPFRYTRVVFTMTGGRGAVWAQLVPIKEQR